MTLVRSQPTRWLTDEQDCVGGRRYVQNLRDEVLEAVVQEARGLPALPRLVLGRAVDVVLVEGPDLSEHALEHDVLSLAQPVVLRFASDLWLWKLRVGLVVFGVGVET